MPSEEQQTFTPPSPSLNVALNCFEGQTMTQPFFQRQTIIDEGEGGCVVDQERTLILSCVDVYHYSGRIWRSTKRF